MKMRELMDVMENDSGPSWLDALSDDEQSDIANEFLKQVDFVSSKHRGTVLSAAEYNKLTTAERHDFFPRIVARWEVEGMHRPGTEPFMNWLRTVWFNHARHEFDATLEQIFPL